MSMKPCIYCKNQISEHAVVCPNKDCGASNPFDQNEKRAKALFAEAMDGFTKCRECGNPIKNSQIINGCMNKLACTKCGYPDNFINCYFCSEKANLYDQTKRKFTCSFHRTQECAMCKTNISGDEVKTYSWYSGGCGGSGSAICCQACYDKRYPNQKQNKPATKSNNPNFLLYIGIGIVVLFLLRACS